MNNNNIEVNSNSTNPSAKVNLTVDLSYEDCYKMCLELFNNLNSAEQKALADQYFMNQQEKIDQVRQKQLKGGEPSKL